METDLADEMEIIDVNVRGTVHLAKLVLRDMADRDEGRVLITSSIASTMPGSFHAVYNASKSFLQSFAEALAEELKDTGITVTSLMPGPTETNFFHRADMDDTKVGQARKDDLAQVAKQGFQALMDGKNKIVAGSAKTKALGRGEQGAAGPGQGRRAPPDGRAWLREPVREARRAHRRGGRPDRARSACGR